MRWSTLFAFGGIYAAGVFGWQTIELGVFGILLTVTGTLGAWAGGWLDDAIGGKPVVLGSIASPALRLPRHPLARRRPCALRHPGRAGRAERQALRLALPERVYLGLGLLIGLVAGPCEACLAQPDGAARASRAHRRVLRALRAFG